jgi:hypothetical protein
MTESEFLSRFQREQTGTWACTKPIQIDGPSGAVLISVGQSFSPGGSFFGLDLAKELDRMAAKQRAASKLASEALSNAA